MTDIANQARWYKVFQNTHADLKALVEIAAAQTISVFQDTAANLKAEVTLKALSEIIVKQATATSLHAQVTPYVGTQILKEKDANNTTISIYTVPGGEAFQLCWAEMGYFALANGNAQVWIENDAHAVQLRIFMDNITAGASAQTRTTSFWPHIYMPASWHVVVYSSALGLNPYASIFGYEI